MFIGHIVVFLGLIHVAFADLLLGLMQPNHDFLGMVFGHLSARQTQPPSGQQNVPTECKPDCDPVNTQISKGCPPDTCCTAAFVTGTFNCLKCVGQALGATDLSPGQAVLDNLVQACAAAGHDVPKLTLPGVSSSRPISSPSVRSTGTVSRPSQITISVLPSTTAPPPTSAISQSTVTAPLTTPDPQGPPQITSIPSGAKSRFFTPHFSQLSVFIALLVGFVSFVL